MVKVFPVHPWPQRGVDALLAMRTGATCVVISVATHHTENRVLARQSIRAALRELLAGYWQQPVASIRLSNYIGEAITVLSPPCAVGLSISHAPGCSLAAVSLQYAIGIDVVRVDTEMVWDARDYLGPDAHQRLMYAEPVMHAAAFAQAWSELEAGLKCLGLGLTEWTPVIGETLQTCKVVGLDLPDTLRGAVALKALSAHGRKPVGPP